MVYLHDLSGCSLPCLTTKMSLLHPPPRRCWKQFASKFFFHHLSLLHEPSLTPLGVLDLLVYCLSSKTTPETDCILALQVLYGRTRRILSCLIFFLFLLLFRVSLSLSIYIYASDISVFFLYLDQFLRFLRLLVSCLHFWSVIFRSAFPLISHPQPSVPS